MFYVVEGNVPAGDVAELKKGSLKSRCLKKNTCPNL